MESSKKTEGRRQCQEKTEKKLQQAGKCSKIKDIHGCGQSKCEILGVKAVLSCQNANLTVMIMSHFKKRLFPVVIFISYLAGLIAITLCHINRNRHCRQPWKLINKIVKPCAWQQPLLILKGSFVFVHICLLSFHSVTLELSYNSIVIQDFVASEKNASTAKGLKHSVWLISSIFKQ